MEMSLESYHLVGMQQNMRSVLASFSFLIYNFLLVPEVLCGLAKLDRISR